MLGNPCVTLIIQRPVPLIVIGGHDTWHVLIELVHGTGCRKRIRQDIGHLERISFIEPPLEFELQGVIVGKAGSAVLLDSPVHGLVVEACRRVRIRAGRQRLARGGVPDICRSGGVIAVVLPKTGCVAPDIAYARQSASHYLLLQGQVPTIRGCDG